MGSSLPTMSRLLRLTLCPENDNCLNGPGGMYHCPYCGAMILPGFSTQGLCLINDEEWVKEISMSMEFGIGQAIKEIKLGNKVARHGWNGKDMWLSYTPGREVHVENLWSPANQRFAKENGGSAIVLPAITMKNARGQIVMGWLASQEDLLAEDWYVVE